MRITIQNVSEELSPDVYALIRRKVRMLARSAAFVKDAVVDIHHDRHHRKGNVASVEIALHLFCHGNLPLRASSAKPDVHAALDTALEKLKRQLATHKEKETQCSHDSIRAARGT